MSRERVLVGGTHSNNGGSKIPPDKETERDTGQDIEMLPGEEDLNISTKEKRSPESQKTVTWNKSFIEVVQGREEHVAENRTIDPPPMVEGNYQVEIDRVVEKNTEKEWGHCLVGSFQGATFKKHILQSRLTGIWRTRAEFKVVPLDQGNYLFRFDDLEDRLGVLMGGPWFVGHHRLRLRLWDIDFDPDDDKISQVPIWIRLQNLPLKFWQNDIILKIAAAVGRPLKLDTFTAMKQSGCFARICVEVDLDKPLTRGVMLKSSTKSKWQSILYEDVPEICSFCMFAGHTVKMCKRKAEEMILTQQVENTGESHPQSTVRSAKEEENPWSLAVRTRRRSRRPIKEGGRKNATGNSFAGHGEEGGPLHQLRKESTESGKPSHANPPSKENIVENGQFVHEKRPKIVKDGSGTVDKISKSREDVGLVLSQGNKFDILAVDEEILPNTIPSLKEAFFYYQSETAHPNQAVITASPAQMAFGSPISKKNFNPSPTQPIKEAMFDHPAEPAHPNQVCTTASPARMALGSPMSNKSSNPSPTQPIKHPILTRTSSSDAELVVDITPCRVEDETEVRNQEMVVFEQYSNDSRKAKDLRLDRMDFCRLTGNKTKGNGENESLPNSHEKGGYQKANKLAKTRSTR